MENTSHPLEAAPLGIPATAAILALPQPPAARGPEPGSDSIELAASVALPVITEEEDLLPELAVLPNHLRQISFRIELRVPISHFTLRDLQNLKPGALLATEHLSVRDLVLTAAGERLLLVELESIEQQLAARVKRLAWRHKWRRKA